MPYNTGNPIGSIDPRDAADNKENFDRFALSTDPTYLDRLGVERKTVTGALQDYAAYNPRGEWTTATAYNINDVWRDGTAGAFYLVLADYTSGASAAADIAGGNVVVHQPKDWVVSVATIADLRNIEPSFDGQQVELLGHTVAGMGGGIFYADYSDTASPDDNGVTVVTAGGKRWVRKPVGFLTFEMFGAIGDGVTDDSQSVLATIVTANGGLISPDGGDYLLTSLIEYGGPVQIQGGSGVFIMEGVGRFVFSAPPTALPNLFSDVPAGRNTASFLSPHGLSAGDVFAVYNPTDYSWSPHRSYYRDGCMFKVDTVTDSTTVKTYGVAPDLYASADFVAYKLVGQGVSIKDITLRPSASTATVLLWVDGHIGVDISGVAIEKGAIYTGIEIWRCFDVRVSDCYGELSGGDSYPVAISNSQKVTISDCELYSARHCIALGGRTGDACVPTRDVLITHCNLYNSSSSGIGSADIHGNCENVHYSNCYMNSGANVAGANVKYSDCVIMGREPDTYPDGNCVYGSEVVKGVFEFENCRFVTYGAGTPFTAFVYLGLDGRKGDVRVLVKDCTGENRGGFSTIRCVGVGVNVPRAGRIDIEVKGFTFVSSVPAHSVVTWSGGEDVSSIASTIIDNLSAPAGSSLVGASISANYQMPMRLPSQSGRQAITAASGTTFTQGATQTFRYYYPRVPNAQVSSGGEVAFAYNGNRAIFGLCNRVTNTYIVPWIESGDATNWTATKETHVMWRVGIDEV